MEILVIATTRIGFDGITSVIMNNYLNMNKKDITFSFIFPNDPPEHIKEQLEKGNVKYYLVAGRTKNTLKYMHEVNKIMRANKFDVLHVHGNSNTLAIELFLAKRNDISIRLPHSHNTFTKYKLLHKLLEKPFNKFYTEALACGTDAGNWLYGEKEFIVIENGIQPHHYKYSSQSRAVIREELGLSSDDKIIGHVGHFTYQKNQEYLVDLFIRNPQFKEEYKLVLVGDGPIRSELEQIVNSSGLQNIIKFVGRRSDINKFYSAFDVLIMPSRFEGLPLTLVEAQAADLKCFVSSNITTEVNVTNNVEFFDLNSNPIELVDRINIFFDEDINRESLKLNETVSKSIFNISRSAEKLRLIYMKNFY